MTWSRNLDLGITDRALDMGSLNFNKPYFSPLFGILPRSYLAFTDHFTHRASEHASGLRGVQESLRAEQEEKARLAKMLEELKVKLQHLEALQRRGMGGRLTALSLEKDVKEAQDGD
ncbi:hypothetical protein Efla_001329 [Eimeria flavescens]